MFVKGLPGQSLETHVKIIDVFMLVKLGSGIDDEELSANLVPVTNGPRDDKIQI